MVLRTNFKAFWVVSSKKNFFWKTCFFLLFCISGVTDFLKNDQLLFWEIRACNLSWTAQMVLRTNFKAFKVVSSEKKFFQKFEIFCLSGVTDFLKNDQRLFWEIPTGNLSWTAQMVLRTNFKAFWVVSSEKNFYEGSQFFDFFCISAVTDFLKMTNFFFERYRPEICRGLHKWCCEQILRHLRLFRAKKKFFKNWKFFYFFCISGVTDFLKND